MPVLFTVLLLVVVWVAVLELELVLPLPMDEVPEVPPEEVLEVPPLLMMLVVEDRPCAEALPLLAEALLLVTVVADCVLLVLALAASAGPAAMSERMAAAALAGKLPRPGNLPGRVMREPACLEAAGLCLPIV
ncbi:MAG TPA: hypothetical protein VMV93_05285, partial [Chloroflexota bacterium]|nr:hypothetical protein [Chloroflexota bacterium]